jgi:hypothetical protein
MSDVRHWALGVLLLVLAGVLAGCAKDASPSGASTPATREGGVSDVLGGQRAVRYTGDLSLAACDVDAAVNALRAAAEHEGGLVAETRISGKGESRSATLVLRVPPSQRATLRGEAGKLGDVTFEDEKAVDVTEQRADVDARLANARTEEKRLLALMNEKAGTLGDVIALEKELASVRERIEQLDAQKRVLEGQIDLATVTVQVTARATQPGAWARVTSAAHEGLAGAWTLLVALGVLVAWTGPTLVVLGLIAAAVYASARAILRMRARRA